METPKFIKVIRVSVSILFSFLMSLIFVMGSALFIVRFEFLDGSSIDSFLGETYYKAVHKDLITAAEDYTLPTAISIDVVKDVFEYEDVCRDVRGYLVNAFAGKEYEPDLTASSERLRQNLARFFETEDVETDGEIAEICSSYIAEINGIYKQKTRMPGLDILITAKTRYGLLMMIGLALLFAVSAAICFFLLKLNRPASAGLNYIAYATGAASIMCFTVPAVLFFSGQYTKLNLAPEYFYRFVIGFIRHLLVSCFWAAGVWLVLTAILIIILLLAGRKAGRKKQETTTVTEEE